MNKKVVIQFKAAFLLFIFSLNMFVGFACSLGLNAAGEALNHHPEAVKQSTNAHNHKHGNIAIKSTKHSNSKPHNHKTDHKDAKNKGNCCNDEVQKVQQLDKNINSNAKIIASHVIADVLQTHYHSYSVILSNVNPTKLRERFFYPPPPNILLIMQRFQI